MTDAIATDALKRLVARGGLHACHKNRRLVPCVRTKDETAGKSSCHGDSLNVVTFSNSLGVAEVIPANGSKLRRTM